MKCEKCSQYRKKRKNANTLLDGEKRIKAIQNTVATTTTSITARIATAIKHGAVKSAEYKKKQQRRASERETEGYCADGRTDEAMRSRKEGRNVSHCGWLVASLTTGG